MDRLVLGRGGDALRGHVAGGLVAADLVVLGQRPDADDLLARITATDEVATAFVGEFGPVMVVHTGPGLAGLAPAVGGGVSAPPAG